MVLYVLNRSEELLTALHNDSELEGITDLTLIEDLEELSTLNFTVSGNTDGIEYLAEENYILTQNVAKKWKLFVVRKIRDTHGLGIFKNVYTEDVLSELGDHLVKTNYIGKTINVKTVLTTLLQGTGFVLGNVDSSAGSLLIEKDTRYMSKLAFIQLIAEATGLNIFSTVTVDGTVINNVTVSLAKSNKAEGKRFEFDGELESIERDTDTSSIKTAILPLGAALEQSEEDRQAGKPVEYVTIKNVEWYKAEGKPLDKAVGTELLVDPVATSKYGIKSPTGIMEPRVVVMQFDDITEPELLAQKAYLELTKVNAPTVNYTFAANDLNIHMAEVGLEEQPVEVGDICYVIDNNVTPPIVQEVVIRRISGDPSNPQGLEIEIGKATETIVDNSSPGGFTGSGGGSSSGGGIKDGSTVNALTIINGEVTNLRVISGSVESLTAKTANITDLTAETARVGKLYVNDAAFDTILAGKADVGTLNAVDADLQNLKSNVIYTNELNAIEADIETLNTKYADIDTLVSGNLTADNFKAGAITADSAIIDSISASKITTGTLDASNVNVVNLSADVIKTGTLNAALVKVTNIDATSIGTGTLDADKITVKNLSASVIQTGTLDASKVLVTNLSANTIVTGTLDASKITVLNLSANVLNTGTLDANLVNVKNINASNISTGILDASKVTVSNVNAGSIIGGTLDAAKVNIISLNAESITGGTLDASKITVKNLRADSITSGTLDGNNVTVKNLRADSIVAGALTIDGSNLIHGSDFKDTSKWELGKWKQDTTTLLEGNYSVKLDINSDGISSNYLRSVDEIKTSSGETFVGSCYIRTPDISKLNGTGVFIEFAAYKADNSITYQFQYFKPTTNNTWERISYSAIMPEGTTKVRIFFGFKGSIGTVNLAKPMLSRGSIVSIWKAHTDELISDGAIDSSKLGPGAVTSDKMFLDEILASRGFIEKFEAVEISANQITTGKLSSELLDVEGLVSFQKNPNVFGSDINWIFDTSQDKTWINGGAIWANSVTADKIDAKGLKINTSDNVTSFQVFDKVSAEESGGDFKEGDVLITGTIQSSNFNLVSNTGYRITKDGDVILNNALVRGDVLLPNAGITNSTGEEGNPVRFWAGSNFENRNNAPFQVLQDGTVKAYRGEFGGTFTGKLEIGNIQIEDTNESKATFKINSNNNAQTLVELTEDTSFINTDFILGLKENPDFTYSKGNSSFIFKNSQVSIDGTKTRVVFPANNSSTLMQLSQAQGQFGDYLHEVSMHGGGLRFDNLGPIGDTFTDYLFSKNGGNDDVTVKIEGNVQVTNTIQLGGIQIVNRTVGNTKRIDFVVL